MFCITFEESDELNTLGLMCGTPLVVKHLKQVKEGVIRE